MHGFAPPPPSSAHQPTQPAHMLQAMAALGSSITKTAQSAAQKATIGGLWITVTELLRDAAARHQLHNLVTLDVSGW